MYRDNHIEKGAPRRTVRGALAYVRSVFLLAALLMLPASAEGRPRASLELAATPSGPYTAHQLITVGIRLRNLTEEPMPLTFVRLDYSDTSAGINLPNVMTWVLVPPSAGNPSLPVPTFTPPSPTLNVVPAGGAIPLGTVTFNVPRVDGCYLLDVLNAYDPLGLPGAEIHFTTAPGVLELLTAANGDITGGVLGIDVGGVATDELCNGQDDDCDGMIDEGFTETQWDPDAGEFVEIGPGHSCVLGEGDCEIRGRLMCSDDGESLICLPVEDPITPRVEGPYLDPTCFDFQDNDCDSLVDHHDPDCQGPEVCDGFDNDDNGEVDDLWPELGSPCVVGMGPCARVGVLICDDDGTGVVCSATPLPGVTEGPPGWFNCDDGFDNDCDGLVDLADPDCQSEEVCDYADNDGDNDVDEDFPLLGETCTVGLGTCTRTGTYICNADGSGVICSVSPGPKTPEGPGCDCGDGLDNDCDGLTDLDDPDCGGLILRARAALPTLCNNPDGDCESWHRVDWQTLGFGPAPTVTAEMLALDPDGDIIGSLPVQQGDVVKLTSRAAVTELSMTTETLAVDLAHFATYVPSCLLGPDMEVPDTCKLADTDCDRDVDLKDLAWLQNHFGDQYTVHSVRAPIPLLRVHANNGLSKANAYASPVPHARVWSPDNTVVSLSEGDRVRVEVDISNLDLSQLELRLDGVDVFVALGLDPADDFPGGPYGGSVALPNGCTATICELIADGADIDTLSANTVTFVAEGLCCGGHAFFVRGPKRPGSYPDPLPSYCHADDQRDTGVSNGFEVRINIPSDGAVTTGDGTLAMGRVCHGVPLPDDASVGNPQVRLNGGLFPLFGPSVTPGDGLFTADKVEYVFEATLPTTELFEDIVSGIAEPGTLDPGVTKLVAEAQDGQAYAAHDVVALTLLPGGGVTYNPDAVTRGLELAVTADALEIAVSAALSEMAPLVVQELKNALMENKGKKISIPADPCSPQVTLLTDDPVAVSFSMDPNDFTYSVIPSPGVVATSATSGPATLTGSVKGSCQVNGLFGECFLRLIVKVGLSVIVDQAKVTVLITEVDLEAANDVTPSLAINNDDVDISVADVGSDVQCWGGVLANILSFGTVESIIESVVESKLQDYLDGLDLTPYIAMIPVPPIPLEVIDFEPVNLGSLGVQFSFDLNDVEIDANGMAVGFKTEFIPLLIDPEIEPLPEHPPTTAPLFMPPLGPPSRGITALVSDDAMNQLLYALTRNGIFKTAFEDDRLLGDLLAANCNTMPPIEQGQCAAIQGADCTSLPTLEAQFSCSATQTLLQQLNLSAATPILLHGRLDVAPKFLIFRSAPGNRIIVYLRLSQAYVGMVADRDGDAVFSGDYSDLPSCFSGNPATATECAIWGSCFDVNLGLEITLTNVGGVPRLSFAVESTNLSVGTGCSGGTVTPGWLPAFDEIFSGLVFDLLSDYVDNNVPPIDLEGLDFGGIITLENFDTIIHGNTFDPIFDDTFGLTADPAP